ncbi:tetratricopeptide repeat protein [Bernardetia sp. OM2101]|uniref:tetratricopeptide repeat protein n=1 Tax=Bernardetia sp. OM2101 TaxID=3344876 RepID=UPI0035CE9F29
MKLNYYCFFLLLLFFLKIETGFAQNQIDSLQKELKNSHPDTSKVNLYNELAFQMSIQNIDSALIYAEKGLELAQKNDFKKGVFINYENTGVIYAEKGDADKAMEYFLKAIVYKEENLPSTSLVEIYRQIGILFFKQKEYQESEKYFKEALVVAQKENNPIIYEVYFNLATLYSKLKKFEESESYFDKCLEQKNISYREKGGVYLNRGNMYQRMKKLKEAEESYQKALDILPKEETKTLGKIYNSLTDVALKTGRYTLAEKYAQKGLEYAEKSQNIRSAIYARRNLSYAYYLSGSYKNAFEVLEEYRKLSDSLIQMTNTENLNELEKKYQNEKKQNEIEKLKQEQILYTEREQATKTRNILFLIIAIITTIVLLLILQLQKTRYKRDIATKEREKENQKQIQLLELREKELQIQQYKEQLHRHTHNLLQKNLVLSELREELNSLKEFEDEEQKYKKQKIEELINGRILTEEDWQNYKQIFSNVYPRFFEKLKNDFPKISKAEKRIATLLKLGLSQYDMATILGISEESARKGKYRLRQRLGVESDEATIKLLEQIN